MPPGSIIDEESEFYASSDDFWEPPSVNHGVYMRPELLVLEDSSDEDGNIHGSGSSCDRISKNPLAMSRCQPMTETPPTEDSDLDNYDEELAKQIQGELSQVHAQSKKDKIETVRLSQLVLPKSRYAGYTPPLPVCAEPQAVEELLSSANISGDQSAQESHTEFELSNFVVYLPHNKYHAYELRGLQDLTTSGHACLLFDGILSAGNLRRYVQAVPFEICSLGNYGRDIHGVGDEIWIQSNFNAQSDIYYRLASPAPEYARFHEGFIWLADLAKHVVDYCQASSDEGKKVGVHDFRSEFSLWVRKTHAESTQFAAWYAKYKGDDFRQAVSANVEFLYKEAVGVDSELGAHPVWSQLKDQDYIQFQNSKISNTIVTPYVYDCFKSLRFGHLLQSLTPCDEALARCAAHGIQLDLRTEEAHRRLVVEIPAKSPSKSGLTSLKVNGTRHVEHNPVGHQDEPLNIQIGDVISVSKDGAGSFWVDEGSRYHAADKCWYIYVQKVHESAGHRSFGGIWLYNPSHTSCAKMKYPYPNELFFSDNCTCKGNPIDEDQVLDVVKVVWHGHPSKSKKDLFVRQSYMENERFVMLQESHKTCKHLKDQGNSSISILKKKYPIGQTVLVTPQQRKHALEPCEVVRYVGEGSRIMVVLRRLLRRNELPGESGCRPNELVYTEETYKADARKIVRTCLVRFYAEVQFQRMILPPYNRDGTGNAFFITTRLVSDANRQKLVPIYNDLPVSLLEGFDPSEPLPHGKLRGLDLYCGGGNFGRGLEEGGAVHMDYAVDYAKNQIHTYYANLKSPKDTKLFYGSVDELFSQALKGNLRRSNLIPMPGDIDFMSAGSPCQGFSMLNNHRNNEKGLKNQSLVASVAAYVDFYRPKYGILENVINMARTSLGRDEDVLSQLVCALVGLGYQLELFALDAWSFGSAQSRSRIFVCFAAPGYEPLQYPALSHSHPEKTRDLGLGKAANNLPFCKREKGPTPFEYVTAEEATKDLPNIGDGRTYQCISHPDHVLSFRITNRLKEQICAIPTYPRGSNFVSTWKDGDGVMSKAQRALFPYMTKTGKTSQKVMSTSKAWGRLDPRSLFQTIVVVNRPDDARMGRVIHWERQSLLTVMEARRAQGYRDEEVLTGSPSERWKILGNSVARTVALALGLSLCDAWLKNGPKYYERRSAMDVPGGVVNPRQDQSTIRQHSRRGIPVIPDSSDEEDQEVQPASAFKMGSLPFRSPSFNTGDEGFPPMPKPLKERPKTLKRSHDQDDASVRLNKSKTLRFSDTPSPGRSRFMTENGDNAQSVLTKGRGGKVVHHFQDDHSDDEDYEPEDRRTSSSTRVKVVAGLLRSIKNQPGRSNIEVQIPSPKRYVPVDNSNFMAYTQTHRYMNNGETNRKHGPKSTW